MISTTEDILKFVNDKGFKKIFVLCGKKSFVTSGAEVFFKKIISDKEIKIFYINIWYYQNFNLYFIKR